MTIHTFPDYEALCAQIAAHITNLVRRKPDAVVCIASGHTPLGVLDALRESSLAGRVDLSRCRFVGLDEWCGIGPDNPGSCRYLLDQRLFLPCRIPTGHIHFYDGLTEDPEAACVQMNETIARLGGLDYLLLGIGMNGHIALNEPGTPWDVRCHVSTLAPLTVAVGQKYFAAETSLEKGMTLGLAYLAEARQTVLMASGESKAAIVRDALYGPVTTELPASIFQTLPHAQVMLDQPAAAAC